MSQELSKTHVAASDHDIAALIADIGAITSPDKTPSSASPPLAKQASEFPKRETPAAGKTMTTLSARGPRQTGLAEKPLKSGGPSREADNGQLKKCKYAQERRPAQQAPKPAAPPVDNIEEGEIVMEKLKAGKDTKFASVAAVSAPRAREAPPTMLPTGDRPRREQGRNSPSPRLPRLRPRPNTDRVDVDTRTCRTG